MKRGWLIIPLLLLPGCMHQNPTKMKVNMFNAEGKNLGAVHLIEQSRGVKMQLNLEGLPPGVHSIHIHEKGKCMAPGFTSTGKHFNPEQKKHGLLHHKGAHAGDLPNIVVNDEGKIKTELMAPNVTLKNGLKSLFTKNGTSIVITKDKDDGSTQPAGKSGKRIACGEISNKGYSATKGGKK